MKKYIAILRGINVSGKNKLNMNDLKNRLTSIGLVNPITYIQSGNIIFEFEESNTKELAVLLEKKIEQYFELKVPVIVFTIEFLKDVIAQNPFSLKDYLDSTKFHITFLGESPKMELLDKIDGEKYYPDEFVPGKFVIYLYCPNGYGRTKLTNNFFESKLKISATTRNWKTTCKLLELAS